MGNISIRKKKELQKDFVSWFEIPAINFGVAVQFYNKCFAIDMETTSSTEYQMAFFPSVKGIGGAIVSGPASVPSETGPLLYLNGGDDLNTVLNKVEEAGGRIIMPKTLINKESGFYAVFLDVEGNKLALHSKN